VTPVEISFRLLLVVLAAFALAAADHYVLGGAIKGAFG